MIFGWLNQWMQKHGYRGQSVKFYVDFPTGQVSAPNPCLIQGSTAYKYTEINCGNWLM